MILIASVALTASCEKKGGSGPSTLSAPSIHVTGKSPSQWTFEYTMGEQDTLSLWIGERDIASYLLIPGRSGVATLTATEKELVLESSGNRVSQVVEGFAFTSGSESVETDGSIIIGQCDAGPVGIRITKEPKKSPSKSTASVRDENRVELDSDPIAKVGLSRSLILKTLGEPSKKSELEKKSVAIYGPMEGWWDKLPDGSKIEIWDYAESKGILQIYYLNNGDSVWHTAFVGNQVDF